MALTTQMRFACNRWFDGPGAFGRRFALILVALTAFTTLLPPAVLQAQAPPIAVNMASTRFQITSRLEQLDQQIASPNTKSKDRNKATAEAAALRNRLKDGDFQVGDRFILTLTKDSVKTDSIVVRDSLLITIANLPEMSLKGVLRAELTPRVSAYVAEFLLGVTVRTQILTRIAVFGQVGRPGFYYMPPDRPLSEVLTVAGGPTSLAVLNKIEIKRSGKKILSGGESEKAIKTGRTLEELNVISGDEITVPTQRKIDWRIFLQIAVLAASLFFTYVNLMRLIYSTQDN